MTNKRDENFLKNQKYDNYFDDEDMEEETAPPMNKIGDSNLKNNPKQDKFVKPDPPRKSVKETTDLEEMDLEELYSRPFSNSQLKQKISHLSEEALQEYSIQEMDYEENEDVSQDIDMNHTIRNLEKKFESDKENYDTLFKLIYLYKLNNEKTKLKTMREYTQNLFPLSDDMWIVWIKDELENAKDFDSKYALIKSHFEKALSDFMCNFLFNS
jgi:hypothetical protein